MNRVANLVLLLIISVNVNAQQSHLESMPGYVNFGEIEGYGEPTVMINIGGSLLKLLGAMSHDDPEAAEMLKNLTGVRVNVYETNGDEAPGRERISEVKALLAKQQWEPIVKVQKPDEEVLIFIRADEHQVHGLTVMAVNEEEAVFINILGNINPDNLNDVMNQFDVDVDLE